MCSDSLTVSAQSLGKRYEIYAQPADRLKQMVLPRLARAWRHGGKQYFDEFWALRDVSFDIRRGETVGIIGCNGSGKSTLLQLVCGTLHPSVGAVKTYGRIAALLELGAGFNPEFTGRENIYLSGLLYGIPESALRKRLDSILEFADIGDFIDQPVKTYSSGMYVRLAFAVAIHVDADTLVIDEALSVGDVRFTQKCMRFLREFQKRGTLLFVSHDTGAVTSLCSRAIWLDQGRMVIDGPAREVVERYLAEQHAADRALLGDQVKATQAQPVPESATQTLASVMPRDVVDPRAPLLNGMATRNLMEVFDFSSDKIDREFGAGGARITHVGLQDEAGHPHRLIMGGEVANLVIEAKVLHAIEPPIFGFYVKDRLGQKLFGDNTYVSYVDQPVDSPAGTRLRAHFRFRMPTLPDGEYSIDVALATGTQENHTQQHWIHDALVFKASESTMRHGLIGIPMHDITIERIGEP